MTATAALLFAAPPLRGQESGPRPDWLLASHSARAFFPVPARAGNYLLLGLPGTNVTSRILPASVAVFDRRGNRLAHRPVVDDGRRLWILAAIGTVRSGEDCVAYYDDDAEAPPGGPDEATCREGEPVMVEIFRPRGPNVPGGWPQVLHMFNRCGNAMSVVRRADFSNLPWIETERFEGRGGTRYPQGWLARLRTVLLCPESGVHRFAFDARDAAYLLVDGQVVAGQGGERQPGSWQIGAPVILDAGPHTIELYNFVAGQLQLRLAWMPPGAEALQPVPAEQLVASAMLEDRRVERSDQSLQAAFAYELQPAYAVRNVKPCFVPTRFTNASVNWLNSTMITRWHFDDGTSAEGDSVVHVLKGARQHRVVMEVRDSLGFTAERQETVDARFVTPQEYAVSAEVAGLPAVAYPADVLTPSLKFEGLLPADAALDVAWEQVPRRGRPLRSTRAVTLSGPPVDVALPAAPAGEVASLTWSVQHHGVTVASDAIRFLEPPFAELPAAVRGDTLRDAAGRILVLVPWTAAGHYAQAPISTAQAFGRVACVDDSLATPGLLRGTGSDAFHDIMGRIVDGPAHPTVDYVALPAWDRVENAYGPLLKLVQVAAALRPDTDVAILSLGLQDILMRQSPEFFERQVAALSDAVSATLNRPVIWVTPPPYPGQAEALRPYAAAVRRVADARHIPVADLFTAFRAGRGETDRLFRGGGPALSQSGQNLAAQMVARALLMAY